MLSFTSLNFIFRFLPIFLIAYYLVPGKWKNVVTIIGSIVFYSFGNLYFIFLLLLTCLLNYLITCQNSFEIDGSARARRGVKGKLMLEAVALDIGVLAIFKILGTFVDGALFPIGLSFYIFKMISFQIDVYQGEVEEKPSILGVMTYFTLFPQITQGPIMRYSEGEFYKTPAVNLKTLEEGLKYFVVGFAMKVALADRVGILWNDINMYGYESISTPLAWLGAFAYSFQLYFDFWGYSLMASGIMVAMGYDFIQNFDQPYSATTIGEFYRRWHMTLGSFFRDYVYIPMGGSRCSKPRLVFNLMLVWALTGIWHGNGLNFLIWGLVLGILIVLEKLLYGKLLTKYPVAGHIYLVLIIPLSWVVFAIGDIKRLGVYFSRLFPFFGTEGVVNYGDIIDYLGTYWWLIAISVVLCIPYFTKLANKFRKHWITSVMLLLLFWYCVYLSANTAGNPFMYLQF